MFSPFPGVVYRAYDSPYLRAHRYTQTHTLTRQRTNQEPHQKDGAGSPQACVTALVKGWRQSLELQRAQPASRRRWDPRSR